MKWRTCAVVTNLMLLVWFALDMVGINFSGTYLVSQSWQDDGVFFSYCHRLLSSVFIQRESRKIRNCYVAYYLAYSHNS